MEALVSVLGRLIGQERLLRVRTRFRSFPFRNSARWTRHDPGFYGWHAKGEARGRSSPQEPEVLQIGGPLFVQREVS